MLFSISALVLNSISAEEPLDLTIFHERFQCIPLGVSRVESMIRELSDDIASNHGESTLGRNCQSIL